MNTRQLFYTAYSAARAALTTSDTTYYESPIGAAMRSTYGAATLWRYKLTTAAAGAAELNRSYRVRSSVRVLHCNALAMKLMDYRAKHHTVRTTAKKG